MGATVHSSDLRLSPPDDEKLVPEMFDCTCSKCRITIKASVIMKQNKQPIKNGSLG